MNAMNYLSFLAWQQDDVRKCRYITHLSNHRRCFFSAPVRARYSFFVIDTVVGRCYSCLVWHNVYKIVSVKIIVVNNGNVSEIVELKYLQMLSIYLLFLHSVNATYSYITNMEVMQILLQIKSTKKKFGMRNLATVTYEVYTYIYFYKVSLASLSCQRRRHLV